VTQPGHPSGAAVPASFTRLAEAKNRLNLVLPASFA
jgi:hypothetical protein